MFQLKFSPATIKHLGLSMYSTLPPVLSELITNSYDADATEVKISISQNTREKTIEIFDDGCGMSMDELNNNFLQIGRNRRETDNEKVTQKYKRKVTGKKGIGKLSMFGICKEVEVESCKDGKINSFVINYDELMSKSADELLELPPKKDNVETKDNSYTKIILRQLTRKTSINIQNLSDSILSRLNLFDDNFICKIIGQDQEEVLDADARKKLLLKDMQFEWNIPKDLKTLKIDQNTIDFIRENNINGKIITTNNTLGDDTKGIALYARGKLANNREFYNVKLSNSHAFSYMSGDINVDYLDDSIEDDNISTARNSLIWENDDLAKLREVLSEIIKKIGVDWKEKRREAKETTLREIHQIDTTWYERKFNSQEDKILAKNITDIVISSDLEEGRIKSLLEYVKGAFEFDIFRKYASEISGNENTDVIIKLMQDWQIIEAKEYYRLAIGRIETINKFKEMIKADTNEVGKVDSMHSFLNQFPWILEPRLSSFEDEQRYRQILINHFCDSALENIQDRRLDFLCKGFGDTLYVLEIKRSQKIIGIEELKQMQEYYVFIQANIDENNSDRSKYRKVKAYIIGKELKNDRMVRTTLKTLEKSDMFFMSYEDMLGQAEQYHRDLIRTYEKTYNLTSINTSKQES